MWKTRIWWAQWRYNRSITCLSLGYGGRAVSSALFRPDKEARRMFVSKWRQPKPTSMDFNTLSGPGSTTTTHGRELWAVKREYSSHSLHIYMYVYNCRVKDTVFFNSNLARPFQESIPSAHTLTSRPALQYKVIHFYYTFDLVRCLTAYLLLLFFLE